MKRSTMRTAILLVFILLTVYCYGAGMMDYFAIYEPWKLIDEDTFPAFYRFQGSRAVNIFVIPSGIMTIFNILAVAFPVSYVNRSMLWYSLAAYAFDWIFSFTMQIPIQLELQKRKDMALINELLSTNWYRFAADTLQFVIICILIWQLLRIAEKNTITTSFF